MYEYKADVSCNELRVERRNFLGKDYNVRVSVGPDGGPTAPIKEEDVLPVVRAILQEAGVDAWVVEKATDYDYGRAVVQTGEPYASIHGGWYSPDIARRFAARLLELADEAERLQKEAEEVDEEDVRLVQVAAMEPSGGLELSDAEARNILHTLHRRGSYRKLAQWERELLGECG
jgi:hypothetical protein